MPKGGSPPYNPFVPPAKQKGQGLLVVISGPSGVGKSTVVAQLLQISPGLSFSISVTTRPPRPNEREGVDYFFVSEKEFFERAEKGDLLEWAQVHGYYYGTPLQLVEKQLEKDRAIVVEVDVQGAQKIRDGVRDGTLRPTSSVFIFLIPPSVDILAFRLRKRKTEDADAMNYRLRAALAELQVMEKYDYIVVNDRVEHAAEKIRAIIRVEKERGLLN